MSNVIIAPKQDLHAVSFPNDSDWARIMDISVKAFRSGLLPSAIKNVEAATIIALKAWELGLSPMLGFHHIHVVNGKPGYSAELMQLLVRRNLPGIEITILETSNTKASVKIRRPEKGASPFTFSFTIEDAAKAKLTNKDVWQQYPRAMLWARCISSALRTMCADALNGASHTPEELGDESAIETTGRAYEAPKEVPQFLKDAAPVGNPFLQAIKESDKPDGMPPLPPSEGGGDWRMTVEQLDALKLHCSKIGWDNKRIAEEIEKIIGRKKGPSQLTYEEYLTFTDYAGYNES